MTDEIWKNITIEPFQDKYEISNLGRVKSLHSKIPKILKASLRNSYLGVSLNNNKKSKTMDVHRLVAFAFLDKPDDCIIVNHKDGNKFNNILDNLEWMTSSQNCQHSRETKLSVSKTYKVSQYSLTGELIEIYDSITLAMKKTGVSDSKISMVCKGKRNKAGEFIWKYTDRDYKVIEKPEGKIFEDFPNYIITSDGKIYSNSYKMFLSTRVTCGYEYITLYNNTKKGKDFRVHCIVAKCYLDNPNNLPVVNHKNYNRLDNKVENLEWCSYSDNMKHSALKM